MESFEQPSATTTERVATTKTKRYLVAACLVGGGVTLGAVLAPVGLAGAQTSDTETGSPATEEDVTEDDTTDTADDDTADADSGDEDDERNGRRGRRTARLENLTEIIGLSTEELRERFAEGLTLAEIAEEQGIATDELVDELVAAVEERIAAAVDEERIDADEAAERLDGVEERVEEFINREPGSRGHHAHGGFKGARGIDTDAIGEALGITAEEVMAGRAEGKTLVEIAAEQGVSEQELVDAIVAEAQAAVDQAEADGDIDADRAEELRAKIVERVETAVNRTPGERSDNADGRHGRRGGQGRRGGAQLHSEAGDGETEETSYSA